MGLQSRHIRINPKLCTNCGICGLICSFTKFKVFNPKKSLIKIHYNYGLGFLEGITVCEQCGNCLTACTTGSIRMTDSVVHIDYSSCTGCLKCVDLCPHNAFVVVNGKPYKCDLCGGTPQCVRFCVRGALNVS